MTSTQRAYSGEADKLAMAALSRQFPADNLRLTDLPYRFSSWAFDDPENVRLWFDDEGQLLAWAALQTPFWTIDFALHPQAESDLLPQVLDWADERAKQVTDTPFGHPAWFLNVFADQIDRIRALEQAGFASQADVGEDSWSIVWMQRPGQEPVKTYRIPAGFEIRPLAGEGEVEAYVNLHQTTFETKNMTVEWRKRTLQHPDYVPDLDIVVAAPDGRLAAFCICWLTKINGELVGQVEPLGCHADFRRFALGRVALAEGLRRLAAHGAHTITVETDSYRDTAFRLYESMGFHVIRDVLVFRKDYEKA